VCVVVRRVGEVVMEGLKRNKQGSGLGSEEKRLLLDQIKLEDVSDEWVG